MNCNPLVTNIRDDIIGIDEHTHFNNAGDSPMPMSVLNKVKCALDREAIAGGYTAQEEYSIELSEVYAKVGRLIGASNPEVEIALLDSATTGWVRAFYSIQLQLGDIIVVSQVEYAANYVAILQQCKRYGAALHVISLDPTSGLVSLTELEDDLKHNGTKVRVVSITWIATNGGGISDAAGVGRLCKQYAPNAVYLLDACQAVGHIAVNVVELQCDVLTAAGRKYLRGPRGTGFLYVREALLSTVFTEPVTIDHCAAPCTGLGSYTIQPTAKRFEQWERNVAALLGLGAAIDYLVHKVGTAWAYDTIKANGMLLRQKLKSIPGVRLHDLGNEDSQCGIVTFTVTGVTAQQVKQVLRTENIFVSISSPSSTPLDAARRELPDLLRASVHYFNTAAEMDKLCDFVNNVSVV